MISLTFVAAFMHGLGLGMHGGFVYWISNTLSSTITNIILYTQLRFLLESNIPATWTPCDS